MRALSCACALLLAACRPEPGRTGAAEDVFLRERLAMVTQQLAARDITDAAVLEVMRAVPRHLFVPPDAREYAYGDHPLAIGHGQTISQPYIVAFMTQALQLRPGDKVLEIGTGSGYQAAVLARLVERVFTIEIIAALGDSARARLARLGFDNVTVRIGDGYRGWPEEAPFDAIMVTAAPDHVPPPLLEQLADGGRLVLPVGTEYQELVRITRSGARLQRERLLPVRFVPMTGEAQR